MTGADSLSEGGTLINRDLDTISAMRAGGVLDTMGPVQRMALGFTAVVKGRCVDSSAVRAAGGAVGLRCKTRG